MIFVFYDQFVVLCRKNNIMPSRVALLNGISKTSVTRWKNGDIRAGTVHVEQSYNFKEKRIKPPKSKAGYRTIPIPDDYLNSLKGWKSRISGSLGEDLSSHIVRK